MAKEAQNNCKIFLSVFVDINISLRKYLFLTNSRRIAKFTTCRLKPADIAYLYLAYCFLIRHGRGTYRWGSLSVRIVHWKG